jgi:alpha-mannosidase
MQYAILPHAGTIEDAGVMQAGYDFNQPLRVVPGSIHGGTIRARESLGKIDGNGCILETIKQSEDGSAWVARVWNDRGVDVDFRLDVGVELMSVADATMLEQDIAPIAFENNSTRGKLAPHEIKTIVFRSS